MRSVEFWDYFETRISQQFPEKISLLPPGADAKAIKNAEKTMKIKFPSAIQDFYRRHDGSGPFRIEPWIFGGGAQFFISLHQMTDTWQFMCKLGEDFERTDQEYGFGTQEGPIKRNYWNRRWIPIAENQGGDNILFDLDPAEGGSIGQIADWWHEGGVSKWISNSIEDWLQSIVDSIEQGKMHIGA